MEEVTITKAEYDALQAVVKAAEQVYEIECEEPPEYQVEKHAEWFDQATKAWQDVRDSLAALAVRLDGGNPHD